MLFVVNSFIDSNLSARSANNGLETKLMFITNIYTTNKVAFNVIRYVVLALANYYVDCLIYEGKTSRRISEIANL